MNSTFDYPLSNDFMWFKMILESFKSKTSIEDPLGYFQHQLSIRNDVFINSVYFYKQCQEHVLSLKDAFDVIVANNNQLPDFSNDILRQVYQCSHVFGYDESIEGAIFNIEKKALIEVEDFDNVMIALGKLISKEDGENFKEYKHSSFKLKNLYRKSGNLTDFRKSLIKKNLIHQDTTLSVFRKIFSGEPIEERVIWIGNQSELYYLVKRMYTDLKLVEDLKQQQWAVAVNCFVDADSISFDRNKLRGLHTPATSNKIDSALNTLS